MREACDIRLFLFGVINIKLYGLFIIALILVSGCSIFLISSENEIKLTLPPRKVQRPKIILYWHSMFSYKDYLLGSGKEMFFGCPEQNCFATYDREYLPSVDLYDALVFHGADYRKEHHGVPPVRSRKQIYIFADLESPVHMIMPIAKYNNYYNWTMTYRRDSDVYRPYGRIEELTTNYTLPTVEEIRKRPKKIAWFVSRCKSWSYRENLKDFINNFMPVDVYGICGTLHCPRSASEECFDMLERDYKFYLSFENSFCQDYVTEKLFWLLNRNVIPIVYGDADYSKIAPPNSVINIKDFDSPESLVKHLKFLDENPQEYLKYFEWKNKYVSYFDFKPTICQLCKKLNEPIQYKSYEDIGEWWEGSSSKKICNTTFIKKFLNIK